MCAPRLPRATPATRRSPCSRPSRRRRCLRPRSTSSSCIRWRNISAAPSSSGLLAMFRRLLKPGGTLIVGDIVPPNLAAPAAALTLLRFGAANGFFWAALVSGCCGFSSPTICTLRKTIGLSHYEESGDARQSSRRRDFPRTRAAAQYRPQSVAHDVPSDAGVTTALTATAGCAARVYLASRQPA